MKNLNGSIKTFHNRTEWRNGEGELHRISGPAIKYNDGNEVFYIDGKRYDFLEDFLVAVENVDEKQL